MIAEIVISPDGKITAVTREGTFSDGVAKLAKFTEGLESSGVKITSGPVFEQHRHNEELVHHHHHAGVNAHG